MRSASSVLAFTRIDALLLLMAVIWGTNYSIVKSAFRDVDPQAFNALRMTIASVVFGLIIATSTRRIRRVPAILHTPAPLTTRDWVALAALGLVGHFLYQYLFIGGLARTSVANSSLILAATPVLVALFTAALGRDRITTLHWTGAAISLFGIYLVVGGGLRLSGREYAGDLMMLAAVCCWAIYTIGAGELMTRHSPVGVTGLSMIIGTLIYVPVTWSHLRSVSWSTLGLFTWFALVYSALMALCVAYTIWYAAVQQIGSARTAVYSNLVPLVGMATAALFLGEPVGARKMAGAAAVIAGVGLTRVTHRPGSEVGQNPAPKRVG